MKLHFVKMPAGNMRPALVRYAPTNADAVATRVDWFESYRDTGLKRSDIVIEVVDVPTDKAGLLAYLNGLVG